MTPIMMKVAHFLTSPIITVITDVFYHIHKRLVHSNCVGLPDPAKVHVIAISIKEVPTQKEIFQIVRHCDSD